MLVELIDVDAAAPSSAGPWERTRSWFALDEMTVLLGRNRSGFGLKCEGETRALRALERVPQQRLLAIGSKRTA